MGLFSLAAAVSGLKFVLWGCHVATAPRRPVRRPKFGHELSWGGRRTTIGFSRRRSSILCSAQPLLYILPLILLSLSILSNYSSLFVLQHARSQDESIHLFFSAILELQVWYLIGSFPGALNPLAVLFGRELRWVIFLFAMLCWWLWPGYLQ